jgi:hypothetical protein
VANRADPGGRTFLDALWTQAPFRGPRAFRQAVARIAVEWQTAGLLTGAEAAAVRSAAAAAPLPA